jgi:lysophospholipase L1-like esterase
VTRLPGTITPTHDLVVILEGANDLNSSSDFDKIIRNLRTMVKTTKQAGKAVLLGTLTPVYQAEDYIIQGCQDLACYRLNPAHVRTLNSRIRTLAVEESVPVVDFEAALGAADLSPDGLHPNQQGYAKMSGRVFETIRANFEAVKPIVP